MMVKGRPAQSQRPAIKRPPKFNGAGILLRSLSKLLRWTLVGIIAALIIIRISALEQAKKEAGAVADQLTAMEQKEAQLERDIENFNDPEWRSSFWKWRTMRHEPGEYYIRFYDRDSF